MALKTNSLTPLKDRRCDVSSQVEFSMEDELTKVTFFELRERLGLSQSEMAELLGVNRTEISRIESKKRVPQWVIRAVKLDSIMSKAGHRTMELDLE